MNNFHQSTEELEQQLGESIKKIRLLRNLDRETLCAQAGVSLTALKNLEGGSGSTTRTLIKILRALGKTEWLGILAPSITINPLDLMNDIYVRQRASGKKGKNGNKS